MSACDKYNELISMAVDGEIDINDKKILCEHLDVCPECSSLFSAFKEISDELKALYVEPPVELAPEIMKKVSAAAKSRKSYLTYIAKVSATAAVIAIIIFTASKATPMFNTSYALSNNATANILGSYYEPKEDKSYELKAADMFPEIKPTPYEESNSDYTVGTASAAAEIKTAQVESESEESTDGDAYIASNVASETADVITNMPSAKETPYAGFAFNYHENKRAKDIWESNNFDDSYCIAILTSDNVENMSGYEQVSMSETEIYYKVPVNKIEEFQEKNSFTEIYYENMMAEYGIVVLKLN